MKRVALTRTGGLSRATVIAKYGGSYRMRWRKLGRVYCPDGVQDWARTYAILPTVMAVDDGTLRVYFASLDDRMMGRIAFLELDARDPLRITKAPAAPVLDLGLPGCFDDCGVNPSCFVERGDSRFLYYIGWQRTERVPYCLYTGCASVAEDGRLDRVSRAPLFDRTDEEPFLRSAPTVVHAEGCYRCYYVSAHRWTTVGDRPYPEYTISMMTSPDSRQWGPPCHRVIDFESSDEFGFGRPWVIWDAPLYKMFYSIRSRAEPYRIGYAESTDGVNWTRRDELIGIQRSETGWDSEMICYPCVVDAGGQRYLFHNGNRHGSTGFGVAVLEQD